VKFPPFPETPAYRYWCRQVESEIVSASGRGDAALGWLHEVSDPKATFESLVDSKGFTKFDLKIAAGLTKLFAGEIGRQLSQRSEDQSRTGSSIRGRQLLWLVKEFYAVSKALGGMFNIGDLQVLKTDGGSLNHFKTNWDWVVSGMSAPLEDTHLEELLRRALKSSVPLKEDLAHYERQEVGARDRSYKFLYDSMSRSIQRAREDNNREALRGGMKTSSLENLPRERSSAMPATQGACNLWAVGPCRFGEKCKFSHDGEAGAAKAAPANPEPVAEEGACQCGNKNRSDAKFCDSCGAEATPTLAPMPVQPNGKLCQLYLNGKCKFGAKCRDLHDAAAKEANDKVGQASAPAMAAIAKKPAAVATRRPRLYASEVYSSSETSEEGSGSSEDESALEQEQ
jgi:hypothetical protein